MAMIETLAGRVFGTRNAVHLAHWATKSYAQHVALGGFYDALPGKIDAIVEAYQGAFGLIGDVQAAVVARDGVIEHIMTEAKWITENRDAIAGGVPAIENLLDDLVGSYLSTYYKLRNLS